MNKILDSRNIKEISKNHIYRYSFTSSGNGLVYSFISNKTKLLSTRIFDFETQINTFEFNDINNNIYSKNSICSNSSDTKIAYIGMDNILILNTKKKKIELCLESEFESNLFEESILFSRDDKLIILNNRKSIEIRYSDSLLEYFIHKNNIDSDNDRDPLSFCLNKKGDVLCFISHEKQNEVINFIDMRTNNIIYKFLIETDFIVNNINFSDDNIFILLNHIHTDFNHIKRINIGSNYETSNINIPNDKILKKMILDKYGKYTLFLLDDLKDNNSYIYHYNLKKSYFELYSYLKLNSEDYVNILISNNGKYLLLDNKENYFEIFNIDNLRR